MAHAAWVAGQAALTEGDIALARRWLDRAHRIAPQDLNAMLALAACHLRLGDPEAACGLFARVAERSGAREAWLGLAAAQRDTGAVSAAVAALARVLSGHLIPGALGIDALADSVARLAGAPGWCCAQPDGTLALHPVRGTDKPALALDGAPWHGRVLPHGTQMLSVTSAGRHFIGSPVQLAHARRVEGFVTCRDGALEGWAWHPGSPETNPMLSVQPVAGGKVLHLVADLPETEATRPLARLRRFHIAAPPQDGPLKICGTDGRDLMGSPLDPGAERRSAALASRLIAAHAPASKATRRPIRAPDRVAVPADIVGLPAQAVAAPQRPVAVVIPVYGTRDLTLACIASVQATVPPGTLIVVIDDASPDAALAEALRALHQKGRIHLLRHARNAGFPAAANAGLRVALSQGHDNAGHDAILLNSDTLTPPGWLAALRAAVHSAPDIGTAAPLSNDATILSYPHLYQPNPAPDALSLPRLAALAARANAGAVVDIPTSVGFCMYIRRECLLDVGLFRTDVFAQGYGEENDFCLRARHLGWRHVAVPGAFVAHVGGQSFGTARDALIARNGEMLERLHPGYHRLIAAFEAANPLAPGRRALDAQLWQAGRRKRAAILVTHDGGGGVERVVRARCAALLADGIRPIVLRPLRRRVAGETGAIAYEPGLCVVSDGPDDATPNLRFRIPAELGALASLLRRDRPEFIEVHHLLGHTHALLGLAQRLRVPVDFHIHDYASFCPRITLVHAERRYCGEPTDTAVCDACVADGGRNIEESIAPADLRARSAADFAQARRIIVPSNDAGARIRRHFPKAAPEQVKLESDTFGAPAAPSSGWRHVCVIGGIGTEKGFDPLLACARDAAQRNLKLRFTVVGHTTDDARLLDTGRVFITGPYEETEAVALIRAQGAHLAWLPSIWPETWCFTLGQAWQAGLAVAAFDLGAPAERIRATGWGWLLPLGLPAGPTNNALLSFDLSTVRHQPLQVAGPAHNTLHRH